MRGRAVMPISQTINAVVGPIRGAFRWGPGLHPPPPPTDTLCPWGGGGGSTLVANAVGPTALRRLHCFARFMRLPESVCSHVAVLCFRARPIAHTPAQAVHGTQGRAGGPRDVLSINPRPKHKNQFLTLVRLVAVSVGALILGVVPKAHDTSGRVQGGAYLWHTPGTS